MQEGKSIREHRSSTIKPILILTLFLLITAASTGFSVDFSTPNDGDNVTDTIKLNTSLTPSDGIGNVTYYHNDSGSFTTEIDTVLNDSVGLFNTSFDTTGVSDGGLWLNITAMNHTGSVNSTVIKVTVDNTAPELTVTAPNDGVNISGDFDINVTWSDATTAVDTGMFNITNSTGHVVHTGTLNATVNSATVLDDGDYNISYNVTDLLGNVNGSVDARAITVDNSAPVINIHEPAANANLSGTVDVNATANDSTTAVDILEYQWENSTGDNVTEWTPLNDTGFNTGGLSSGDDVYTLQFRSNNTAGVLGTKKITVYVDNDGPVVDWTTPADYWHTSDSITITADVTDLSGVNISTLNFSIDDVEKNASNSTLSFTTSSSAEFGDNYQITYDNSSLQEGVEQNVSIDITDVSSATRRTFSWINFSVDTVKPNASTDFNLSADNFTDTLVSDRNGLRVLNYTKVNLSWSGIADATSGIGSVELLSRNASFNQSTQNQEFDSFGSWQVRDNALKDSTFTWETFEEGYKYELKLRVNDSAGLTNESNTMTVAIDTSAPVFAQNATGHNVVGPFAWTNLSDPAINATVTDIVGMDNASIFMNVSNTSGSWEKLVNISGVSGWNKSTYTVKKNQVLNLTDNQTYNVTVNATDLFGVTSFLFWNFSTDFDNPHNVSLTEFETAAENYTSGSTVWYRDNHTVQVMCDDELSGPKDVAVFTGDGMHLNWNRSLDASNRWNATLTGENEKTYTFKCRDVAGNVNASQNETFHIDTTDPKIENLTVSGSKLTDGDSGMSTNFTIKLFFEEDGSGIDEDESESLSEFDLLENQNGDLDNDFNWKIDDGYAEVEVSELDNDESYRLKIVVVDNVGHETVEEVEFRTKKSSSSDDSTESDDSSTTSDSSSSGGGGSSVVMNDLPSSVTVVQGETTSFDVVLDNIGTTDEDDVTFYIYPGGGVTVSVDTDEFDLDAGSNRTVRLTVDASDADVGDREARLYLESSSGVLVSDTFEVDVVTDGAQTGIDGPEDVAVEPGAEASAVFTVENDGSDPIENLVLNLTMPDGFTGSVSPETVDYLLTGESVMVDIAVTAGKDVEWGLHEATLNVYFDGGSMNRMIEVKVQPEDEAVINDISQEIKDLEDRFNRSKSKLNASAAADIESLLQEAKAALASEDYAEASALEEQIEQRMSAATGQGGIPLLPAVAVVILGGLVTLFGYGSIRHQDLFQEMLETQSKGYSFHEPPVVEQALDVVKGGVMRVVMGINNAVEHVTGLEPPVISAGLFSNGEERRSYAPKPSKDRKPLKEQMEHWFDRVSERSASYQVFEYFSPDDVRSKIDEKRSQYDFTKNS